MGERREGESAVDVYGRVRFVARRRAKVGQRAMSIVLEDAGDGVHSAHRVKHKHNREEGRRREYVFVGRGMLGFMSCRRRFGKRGVVMFL